MNSNFSISRGRKRAGFTIMELLVAAGITTLLIAIMVTVVSTVLNGWKRATTDIEATNQIRGVLDYLARDIEGALIRRDANVWLAATIQQNQAPVGGDAGVLDASWPDSAKPAGAESLRLPAAAIPPPPLTSYRFGQAGVWLRLFVNAPDNLPDRVDDDANGNLTEVLLQRVTAPRAVAYQIVRRPVSLNSPEIRYQLFRSEVFPMHATATIIPQTTFGVGFDLFGANGYNDPAVGGVTAGLAGTLRRPLRSHLLASNVVDFGVRIWARNAAGDLEIRFPRGATNLGFAATTRDSTTAAPAVLPPALPGAVRAGQMTYGFPEEVEVFVRILTGEGVTRLSLLENPPAGYTTAETWWGIVAAHSEIYTRRIKIAPKPL